LGSEGAARRLPVPPPDRVWSSVSNHTITLVEDPLLRRSLRNLYPELPPWARRWIVATPGQALRRPPDAFPEAWRSVSALRQELQRTCDAVNASDPLATYAIRTGNGQIWVGPSGPHFSGAGHPAADGRLVEAVVKNQSPWKLSTSSGRFLLSIVEGWGAGIDWRLATSTGEVLDGILSADGRRAVRSPNSEPFDLWPDGTGVYLQTRDRVPMLEQGASTCSSHTAKTSLLARWRTLSSATDRRRVGQFWLGHPHPLLAELGLETLHATSIRPSSRHR
jgi:hypothetical protein